MIALLLLAACGPRFEVAPRAAIAPVTDFFVDISDESGIREGNYEEDPRPGVVINDHSRLAFADLDGDGLDDVVMHSLFPNVQNGVPFEHLVFRNHGDGTFSDVSDASGLRDVQAAFFAFADVDNDGDQDLFAGVDLQGAGSNAIYLNDGSGVFTRLEDSGVEGVPSTAANAVFLDVDGDAIVDLFVGLGGTTYLGRDVLLLGQGDGTFVDASDRLPNRPNQPSNGTVACDFDDDGDLDIFVSTYSVSTQGGLNHLWRNDGGTFTEVGVEHGFASLPTGNYHLATTGHGTDEEPDAGPGEWIGSNGFGIDCADIDGDGHLDIFLTTISHPVNSDYNRKWSDPSQLLLNDGPDAGFTFTNAFLERGLPFNEGDLDGAAIDFDLDGRLDLSLSRERKYEGNYTDDDQKGWFGLMHQQPDGQFASVGLHSGINDPEEELLRRMKGAQNHAWSDIDGDGDLDLLVGGRDQGGGRPNFLFRNDVGHLNRWLKVRIEGDGVNVDRDGFGTRVTLTDGEIVRMAEKKSSRGMYNSEDTRVLHFGLHDLDVGATLAVRWLDGTQASFTLGRDFGDDMTIRLRYPDQLEIVPR